MGERRDPGMAMKEGRGMMRFSIGKKIAASLLTMVVLVAVVSFVAFSAARKQSGRFESVRLANERATTVQGVDRAIVALQRDVEHYTFTGHQSIAEAVRARGLRVRSELDRIQKLTQTQQEAELVQRLQAHLTEYEGAFEQAVDERALRHRLVSGVAPEAAKAFEESLMSPSTLTARQRAIQQDLADAMYAAERSLYQYLHHPRFKLLTDAERRVNQASADFVAELGPDAPEPESIQHARRYTGTFTRIVQATRGYLHLTGVVMAGEAFEFGYVTKQLRDSILSQVAPMSEAFARDVAKTRSTLVLVCLGAICVALFVASLLSQNLLRPIAAISRTLTDLANDREADIPGTERHDEIGQIAQAADVFKRKNQETKALLERAQHLTTQLEQHKQQLEKSNNELEQFVYTVSHDLKSPVVTSAGFLGMIRRLAERGEVDRAIEKLDALENANRRMAHLIDDLLHLSRVGRVDLETSRLDPKAMLDEWKRVNQPQLEEAHLDVVVDQLPAVDANPSRFMQVFDNLLTNALKYGRCASGNGEISVAGQEVDGEVRYCVRDHGPGIRPEYHEKVFGLFQRLSTDTPGTGVGLAIVDRIMKTHGGRVWIESTGDNDGARFWVAFPKTPVNRSLEAPYSLS